MSDHTASEHHVAGHAGHGDHLATGHAPAAAAFSDKEIAELHAADFDAAKAVVCLMLGIFCMGVGLYSIVAYWVVNFS